MIRPFAPLKIMAGKAYFNRHSPRPSQRHEEINVLIFLIIDRAFSLCDRLDIRRAAMNEICGRVNYGLALRRHKAPSLVRCVSATHYKNVKMSSSRNVTYIYSYLKCNINSLLDDRKQRNIIVDVALFIPASTKAARKVKLGVRPVFDLPAQLEINATPIP